MSSEDDLMGNHLKEFKTLATNDFSERIVGKFNIFNVHLVYPNHQMNVKII